MSNLYSHSRVCSTSLNRVIVPGRAFMRRMYAKLKCHTKGKQLKQHHHVWLDAEFIQDCKVWQWFLQNLEVRQLCRPFVDFSSADKTADLLDFASDASKNKTLGMGAVYNEKLGGCAMECTIHS